MSGMAGSGAGGAAGGVGGATAGSAGDLGQAGTLPGGGTAGGGSSGTGGSGATSGSAGAGDAGAAQSAGGAGAGGEGGHALAGADAGGAGGEGGVTPCTSTGEERCDGLDNDCNGDVDDGETCPNDCFGVADDSGHGYMICNPLDAQEVNYSVARAACQAQGFDLVIIETEAENNFLVGVINPLLNGEDTEFWIGATDEVEDAWFWVNGEQFYDHTTMMAVGDYVELWGPNRPNDAGPGEDCGALIFNQLLLHGLWNDLQCDGDPSSYICEVPAD